MRDRAKSFFAFISRATAGFPPAQARLGVVLLVILCAAACPRGRPGDSDPVGGDRQPHFLAAPLKGEARRIVSLAPSVTELIFALGLGDRLVGVTRFCDDPPEAKSITQIGGFLDPSLEAVIAQKPDLVVAVPNGQNRQVTERLSELGIPVLLLYAYDIDDVERALAKLGQVLHLSQAAAALTDRTRADLDGLAAQIRGQPSPSVLFVVGHRPLVAAGPGSYAHDLLRLAGARNVLKRGGFSRYPVLSLETVLRLAPEVIIDAYQAGHGSSPESADYQRLTTIPAIQNHRVFRLADNVSLRPGSRVAADARRIAALLHPGIFASEAAPGSELQQGSGSATVPHGTQAPRRPK